MNVPKIFSKDRNVELASQSNDKSNNELHEKFLSSLKQFFPGGSLMILFIQL